MLWYCLTNIVDSKCFITTTLLCFITAFYCGYLMNGWENCMRSSLNSLNKQRVYWFYWIFFWRTMIHTYFLTLDYWTNKNTSCVFKNSLCKGHAICFMFSRIFCLLLSFGPISYLSYTLFHIIWYVYNEDKKNHNHSQLHEGLIIESYCLFWNI